MAEQSDEVGQERGKETMTVGRLIECLQGFPPELMVVTDGYEGGLQEVSTPGQIKILLNAHKAWYYGPHEIAGEGDDGLDAVRL